MTSLKYLVKIILYQPLFNVLIFLVWLLPGDNVGWAIVILTLLIRLALLSPSAQALRAQKEMQEIQPEIEKIKSKYKSDLKTQNEKIIEFYKQNKVNPLGSCLPLLVQLPILVALYYVFIHGLDTSHFDLLYPFTPRPSSLNTIFLGLDLTRPSIYLAILAGLSQFLQSKQLTPKLVQKGKKELADKFQKALTSQFTYFMPIFTLMIALSLPSALSLYWSVTSIFSFAQQSWFLKKTKKSSSRQVLISVRRKNG